MASAEMLVLEVEASARVARVLMRDPMVPSTWAVDYKDGTRALWSPKSANDVKDAFVAAQDDDDAGDRNYYVSIDQERDGQHIFLRLDDVVAAADNNDPSSKSRQIETENGGAFNNTLGDLEEARAAVLERVRESDVKTDPKARLLYARAPTTPTAARPAVSALWDHVDLAPRLGFTNYSVVPWLCLGRTRALLLSDEATLLRPQPREKIFEHVTLVVNCHEDRVDPSKYRAVSAARRRAPEVVAHAVHRWFSSAEGTVEKNDATQRAIWRHLQDASSNGGSVAVHCLAGIHRAAMITACQFLYRYYQLGHRDVPCDCGDIYAKLQSVRPAVSPAYLDILRTYEAHCKRVARSGGAH